MLRQILIATCLIGLAACGKKYPMIPKTVPAAQLHITRTEGSRIWQGVSTFVWIYENPDCVETDTSGHLSLMTFSNDGGLHRIRADRRLYIITNTSTSAYSGGLQGTMTESACVTQVSFIPEAGRRYELTAAGVGIRCGVALADASGEIPSNLTIAPPPRTCTGFVNAIEAQKAALGQSPSDGR
jgi:hypothetical protein